MVPFTVGTIILSSVHNRFLSEINPYAFSSYTNMHPLTAILIFLTIMLIYAHLAYLRALEVILFVVSLFYSIALVLNTYLFHTPDRVAEISANHIIREGKIRTAKVLAIKPQIDWKKIMNEACRWHGIFTATSDDAILSITEKACHQALVIKKLKKIDEYANDLVPFIIGFFVVNPYINVKSEEQKNHEMYVRFLVKELVIHKEFKQTNYYKQLLGGIMVGCIINKVFKGSFTVISKKEDSIRDEKRDEESKALIALVKDVFSNFNAMVCENNDEKNINNFKTILSECTYVWLSIIVIFSLVMQEEAVSMNFKEFINYARSEYGGEDKAIDIKFEATKNYYSDKNTWFKLGTSDLWEKLMITECFKAVNRKGQMEWASADINFEKLACKASPSQNKEVGLESYVNF